MNPYEKIMAPYRKTMNPVPLYIHIPFCKKKCAYCDFCSYVPHNSIRQIKNYFSLLKNELHLKRRELDPTAIIIPSIYFGGGTPSLVEPEDIAELIEFIAQEFKLDGSAEISMEANPESVDLKKLKAYRAAGINRLSLGIQTLDEKVLKYLGRLANRKQNLQAAENAGKAGFQNINYDLMFGLPFQSSHQVCNDISVLLQFNPSHFSLYSLILHRGTALYSRIKKEKPLIPDERNTYDKSAHLLEKNGFKAYELSNFAKPGFQCQHNLIYWNYGEYAAIGLSGVGRTGNIRYSNHTDPIKYEKALKKAVFPVKHREILDPSTLQNEYLMMNFRTTKGINRKEYICLFGKDLIDKQEPLARLLRNKGLIGWNKERVYIQKKGRFISNSIIVEFFS